MAKWGQFNFPDFNSEMAARLFYYHDLALIVVVVISVLVLSSLVFCLFSKVFVGESMNLKVKNDNLLEVSWSTFPFFILCGLGFVSLKNLYDMEVGEKVKFLMKVTGHQWYWEYSYETNFSNLNDKCEFSNFVKYSVLGWDINMEKVVSWMLIGRDSFDFDIVFNGASTEVYDDKDFLDNDSDVSYFNLVVSLKDSMDGGKTDSLTKEVFDQLEGFYGRKEGLTYEIDELLSLVGGRFSGRTVLRGIISLYLSGEWYLKYDSYLVPEEFMIDRSLYSLKSSGFRNQDVSAPCFLARSQKNEVLVHTADVMHSWGVSELGVKADAVPGRVNSLKVVPLRSGVSFGFCYELCGAGHSQMPIVVFSVNKMDLDWIIKTNVLETDSVLDYMESMS
uniref:Cytochrome c oxidase subunit 2 n=2 Tax=Meretrix TaxID=74490 RepID=C8CP66_MERMT|nr:cytochrome c oxidase subunit II [Meretrix petechialis]YP_003162828.1 cytochrome c oxidase subunit II [Meretrix meretrix]ABV53325.1 cytochrome c oxidase subunit II [Meretrix petechialis]ACU68434.1 cytochrome c oxidase subunit II [Meretrix meretrix]